MSDDSVKESELELERSTCNQIEEGNLSLKEDSVIVSVVDSVVGEEESGRLKSRGRSSNRIGRSSEGCWRNTDETFSGELFVAESWDCEIVLLSDSHNFGLEVDVLLNTKSISVFSEDVSCKEDIRWVIVWSSDSEGVDVVESGVDMDSGAGSSVVLWKFETGDSVDSIASVNQVVVVVVVFDSSNCGLIDSCDGCVERGHLSEDVARRVKKFRRIVRTDSRRITGVNLFIIETRDHKGHLHVNESTVRVVEVNERSIGSSCEVDTSAVFSSLSFSA